MFSPAYKRYALSALTTVYMLNLVDRGLMALLLQPIKEDLHLSDTQLGFLTGIAFGLFYATLGIPMARWADRGNRATITSIAIGMWGATVMACLFVTNYFQLVLARIAAAIGESGCKPPTYSLVGDYFPAPAERSRGMAIYMSGGPLSALLSLILGGWLNERYGWRFTFFLMGIPGLILAVLIKLTIVEPRTRVESKRISKQSLPSMRAVLETLWYRQSCRHLSIALIVLFAMGYGLGPWKAAFMMRSHGMGTAELGVWWGLILSLGGIAGLFLGSYAANRWFTGNERGQLRMSAVMVSLTLPFDVAFLIAPGKHQALIALIPSQMAGICFVGPVFALMQRLVPNEMRATVLSVIMLLANVIGMGIGPQIVGVLSDWMTPSFGVDSLRYAMLTMSLLSLLAAYHLWKAGRTVRKDLQAVLSSAQINAYHEATEPLPSG